MVRLNRSIDDRLVACFVCGIGLFVALALTIAIALLVWQLVSSAHVTIPNDHQYSRCPPNPCLSTTLTSTGSTLSNKTSITYTTSMNTMQTSISITSDTSTKPSTEKKRTYKELCDQLYDCYTEYGLLCEYGWSSTKRCLCEGSHYWSMQQNKCLRKGEINDTCEIDYECHREIGLVCDTPPNASEKICVCAASLYWAKDSTCGQTNFRHIVDCVYENYATTCFVRDINDMYHMLTIRSISEQELSFDWFLVDNRVLEDLPRLSCALNNETKYCFGLSATDSQHSLKLAQFTKKGFHSMENIGNSNQGIAFGLTDIHNASVFVRDSENVLYRQIISDDEVLPSINIASSLTGDPACYIHEVRNSRKIYCFARNSEYGLSEYAEVGPNTWMITNLGNDNQRIRDETGPTCSYVGELYRYCFVVFENNQIYQIVARASVWNAWQPVAKEQQLQFISQPCFLTSKLLNQSDSDQICYLIAIDTNNHLQLSINQNCASMDNFSDWMPMATSMKFRQFDKPFRLRDGNIGVLGIDTENRPFYIFLDRKTNRFSSPRPTYTVKPYQYRP